MAMELQGPPVLIAIVGTLGFITVCRLIVNIFMCVWLMFLRPPKNLKECYGSWAVVTGCTDGIGKALALELASKGLNLVLVGRNPSKLEVTSNEILARNGSVEVKTIIIDFAKLSGEEIAKSIEEGIEGLDVGVLINNVGLAYPYARFFHEVDSEMLESVIRVNVQGTTWVTRSVLPGMLKRKRGAIVNMGSCSSVLVSSYPLYTLYAATKAYIATFSKSISLEYKQHGIDIQCQIPLFIATKMTQIERSSFVIPSPETFSKASLRAIGYEQVSMPYWSHYVQWILISALPDALSVWCVFQYFLDMRKRGQQEDSMMQKKA